MSDVMPIEQAEFIDNLQRWFNESTNMCHEDCYRFAFIVWQHKDYLSKVLLADERVKVLDEVENLYTDWLYSEYGKKADTDNLAIRVINYLKSHK